MVKNYTFTIDQFSPFFFYRCVQFVQLTTVDIRINRLVPWKQLKKYHTFPIPPNRQNNAFLMRFSFRSCLWWFIKLGPWSFSNDVILNNPFFITNDNLFKKGSNSFHLRCKSQAFMRFVKWISFNSCKIQILIRKREMTNLGICKIVLQFIILDNVSKTICQPLQIIKIIWFENFLTLYESKQIYKNVKINKYINLIKK